MEDRNLFSLSSTILVFRTSPHREDFLSYFPHVFHCQSEHAVQYERAGQGYRLASVLRSEPKIHLPQLINEEAIADEFSNWEQVS